MPAESEARVRYEHALRVIGHHLDAEPAYHTSILEVPEGFTVRSHRVRHRSEGQVRQFSWERLRDIEIVNTAARRLGRRSQRHRGLSVHLPSDHEDCFRAIGYTLDSVGASSVSIDEVPDGIAVSYVRSRDDDPTSFEKCHRILQPHEIASLLREATSRRRPAASKTA